MATVGYLYISDASCDYILVINTSMLLGNIFGNKGNHTAVKLSVLFIFVLLACITPLLNNNLSSRNDHSNFLIYETQFKLSHKIK